MFKFVSRSAYDAHEIVDGEVLYTNPLRISHQKARISPDGTEVVISTNHHEGECGCLTEAEAAQHIEMHWQG